MLYVLISIKGAGLQNRQYVVVGMKEQYQTINSHCDEQRRAESTSKLSMNKHVFRYKEAFSMLVGVQNMATGPEAVLMDARTGREVVDGGGGCT